MTGRRFVKSLDAGAQEVRIVSEDGDMRVNDVQGERQASAFPVKLSLPRRSPKK
jgi:hypothetical protein